MTSELNATHSIHHSKAGYWTLSNPNPFSIHNLLGYNSLCHTLGCRAGRLIFPMLVTLEVLAGGGIDNWCDLPPLPIERQEVGVASLDGKVYVVGGIDKNGEASGLVSRFDTTTGEWEELPPLPEGIVLHHVGAAAAAGRIYCIGGLNATFQGVDTVFAFLPETNLWEEVAGLNRPRGAAGVAVIADQIYVAGGQTGQASVSDFEVYSPLTNRWEMLAPMPTARNHLAAVGIDGIYYAVGGRAGGLLDQLESYNPGTGDWATLRPMPTARGGIAAATVAGQIFVFGGEGNQANPQGIFSEVESYDPASNEWTSRLDMVHPRHGIGAATVGDRIYIPGGSPVQGLGTTSVHDVFLALEAAPFRLLVKLEAHEVLLSRPMVPWTYLIESSDTLRSEDWLPVQVETRVEDTVHVSRLPLTTSKRFYRLRITP